MKLPIRTKYEFYFLNGKKYYLDIEKYRIDWVGKSPSKIQFDAKQFFQQVWKRDFVCEELLVHPKRDNNYRIDIINITKKVAVEVHGSNAHQKFDPYWHKTEDEFWDGLERDRLKQLWCEKNKFLLIELYPQNFPIQLEWLKNKYPSVLWPKLI